MTKKNIIPLPFKRAESISRVPKVESCICMHVNSNDPDLFAPHPNTLKTDGNMHVNIANKMISIRSLSHSKY